VGKTTIVNRACEGLSKLGIPTQGFYTEEVREHGQRTGFDVVTLNGDRGPLASIKTDGQAQGRQYTVGKYNVRLTSFENTAIPSLISKYLNKPQQITFSGDYEYRIPFGCEAIALQGLPQECTNPFLFFGKLEVTRVLKETIDLFSDKRSVIVIDEIGKMELFSQSFIRTVKDILDKPGTTVLATIPIAKGRPIPFVEEVRNRKDSCLF
ncbi:hypothetical protein KUTeg_013049, partial [Tegillarca granosa]